MSKKTGTKCWCCGEMSMLPNEKLGPGWYECTMCSATHFPNPTGLGRVEIVVEKMGKGKFDTGYRPRKRRLPKATARE